MGIAEVQRHFAAYELGQIPEFELRSCLRNELAQQPELSSAYIALVEAYRRANLIDPEYYYRFASGASSREAQRGGGWWVDFENFSAIRSFAEKNGYSIREAARLMLALPYAWTQVNVLIRALSKKPLKAYAGEGKPARGTTTGPDKGTLWIPTQHVKIRQLYIPGLYIKGIPPQEQLFESAFQWPAQMISL